MLFCYIDESGTPQIPGNTSHYVLAGLSMPVYKWKNCESQISKIKTKYFLQNAEIHTGWLMWPYLDQKKVPDFEKLDHATRVYEVEKRRNAELLRLNNPKTIKQYYKAKKNYSQTKEYIHLTFTERQNFILEIANDDLKSRLKSLEEKAQKPTGLQDRQLPTTDSLPAVRKDSVND